MSQRLGDFLKEARVKAGLSLDQLATRTRIRVENLAALEAEELDALPADPYVRGFVKIVCRELRLSPDEGLALYSKLRSNTILPDEITWSEENTVTEPGALEKALQNPDRVMDLAKRVRRWVIPVVAILILGLLTLVVKGGKILAKEDDGNVALKTEKSAPAPKPVLSKQPSAPLVDSTTSSIQEPPAAKKLSTDGIVPKEEERSPVIERSEPKPARESIQDEPAKLEENSENTTESSTSSAEATGELSSSGISEPAPTETTTTFAPPPVPGAPLILEVLAVRDAEVTLVLDGVGLPRKRSLIAGERKTWKADSLFVL
ncbi:MAG TPA: helix-turn-helix domain-containing protein, partial [bacterium]|nr:helix-turn-helix domain-containing protein [bacterium]